MHHDELLHALRMWLDGSNDFPVAGVTLNPFLLELLFWAVVIAAACVLLWRVPRTLVRAELAFRELARHRTISILGSIVLALGLRAALLPLIPIPTPGMHDEFSYLLGADTFASGHLTNPTPPMWVHFESFSINMQPTYQSMYPPGQAAVMALGEVIFGHPWWGVWLSVGLMCGVIVWMLQGWMPSHWALLGGLFCVMRYATFSYWINSYWGGAVAAIGGALLLGALVRLSRKLSARNAVLLALALVLLANTRPYEGLVFSAPAIIYLLARFVRQPIWRAATLRRLVLPAMAVLVLAAGFGLYYNWRSTGNPLLMPYVVNEHTYHITRPFLWQAANPIPAYRHRVMRTFYCFHELPEYFKSRQGWGLEVMMGEKVQICYVAFIWPLFLLTLPAAWQMMKSRKQRLLAITPLVLLGSLLVESWHPHSHYAAQALGAVIAVGIYGLRSLRLWKPRGMRLGLMAARGIVVVMAFWMLVPLGETILNPYLLPGDKPFPLPQPLDRSRLEAQLERTPGQHLVIVHNHLSHTGSDDWIYNRSDIDHAKVVWARDMGAENNQELVQYFNQRTAWMVDQDDGIMRLEAYNQHSAEDILALTRVPAGHGQSN